LRGAAGRLLQSHPMKPVDLHDVTDNRHGARAVAAVLFIAALAVCAYAGGRSRGAAAVPGQARGGGITLNSLKARAQSGKPAGRGPSANVGQSIVLVGSGFDSNVSVQFTAFANSTFSVLPLKVKGKRVTVAVPAEVVTGGVSLIDPDTGTSGALTLQIVPKIDTLTPTSVAAGGRLLIDGTGFSPDAKVVFRGVRDPVTPAVVSPVRIDVVVPAGAQTGKLSVVTNGGTSKPVKLTIPGSVAEAPPRAKAPAPTARRTAPRR
jgi:IPT/TIG domain